MSSRKSRLDRVSNDLLDHSRKKLAAMAATETNAARRMLYETELTDDNYLQVAAKFIEVEGDVPEDFMHGISMYSGEYGDRVQQLRVRHFAKLGKPVPEYPGNFPR